MVGPALLEMLNMLTKKEKQGRKKSESICELYLSAAFLTTFSKNTSSAMIENFEITFLTVLVVAGMKCVLMNNILEHRNIKRLALMKKIVVQVFEGVK